MSSANVEITNLSSVEVQQTSGSGFSSGARGDKKIDRQKDRQRDKW